MNFLSIPCFFLLLVFLDFIEEAGGDIVSVLVEYGIFDILKETFVRETDETILVFIFLLLKSCNHQ